MENIYVIEYIDAIQVLDSRGDPTVEAIVKTKKGIGRAISPSGASRSSFEAYELRDGDPKIYKGRSVLRAVDNIRRYVAPALVGLDSRMQRDIDQKLIQIDGTPNKSRLGGNATTAVSLANLKAAADTAGMPLYAYIGGLSAREIPVPMMNLINGGAHAGNELSFQEFLIVPTGFDSFSEALRAGVEVYKTLKDLLKEKYGKSSINVGDEGGFAPPMRSIYEALDMLEKAISKSGYSCGDDIYLALDIAASQIYRDGFYIVDDKRLSKGEMIDLIVDLSSRYPLLSIEDPLEENDLEGFSDLRKRLGKTVVVGDDLLSTNKERLRKAIEAGAVGGAIMKINQAGTFTEAMDFAQEAMRSGVIVITSHRSGDTEDTSISHIAIGLKTQLVKMGAPARGERTSKYNEILRIEHYLGGEARYMRIR
ncbi:MAG: phosphopyruvate hydratase [Desulfurococcaceae archaeon]|nr:MAG: phosphopyruvate hydratase [Desulfurococcaceae archaeon]